MGRSWYLARNLASEEEVTIWGRSFMGKKLISGKEVDRYLARNLASEEEVGIWFDFDFWCWMPLSVIFQLYHGDQF